MSLFVAAYLAGAFTLLTPCILPILPFILTRADGAVRRDLLPMLLGLAIAFALMASLAAIAGGWAVAASQYGRAIALGIMAFFGLTLLLPGLAARLTAPVVARGAGLLEHSRHRATGGTSSLLVGVATGMIWAPCAGPVLGLILTGAALNGPSVATFFLLLSYGLGAASALAIALLLGRRLLGRLARWGGLLRPALGAAIVAGAAFIWAGLDTGYLARWSADTTTKVERHLLDSLKEPFAASAQAASGPQPSQPQLSQPQLSHPRLSQPLASLAETDSWVNGRLGPQDLRGKVVLVNFWTYSCINCLRSLPYVRAWAAKYRDRGLVVIGAHTPEFAFEKDIGNVAKATRMLDVTYPVAIDNDFRIWRAFGNQAWPAFYFIGADGEIRSYALGEGNYAESERLIQQLLAEADRRKVDDPVTVIVGEGAQAAPDLPHLNAGETYIGYARAHNFASPDPLIGDAPADYRAPAELDAGEWSLAGRWSVGGEFATLADAGGGIAYRFHARDLHLVMAPASAEKPIRFRVTIDGRAPGADHGSDVDAEGWGELREDRLYQLIRQKGEITDRTFRIEFSAPGARAYAFTFG